MARKTKQLKQKQSQKQIVNIHLGRSSSKKTSSKKTYTRKPVDQSYSGNYHPVYIETPPRQEPLSNVNAVLQTIAELRNEMKPMVRTPHIIETPAPAPPPATPIRTPTLENIYQRNTENFHFENPARPRPKKRDTINEGINETELREGFYGFTQSGRVRSIPTRSQTIYMQENNIPFKTKRP